MQEIEVKILEINKTEVIKKLEALGAQKVFDDDMEARLMDFLDERLWKEHKVIRLRRAGNKIEFTLKDKYSKTDVKSAEEYQVIVSDIEITQRILEGIGLEVYAAFKKHRLSYKLGNVEYEIDDFVDIPTLLEIQAQSKEEIETALANIGYSFVHTKPWSWKQVLDHYGKPYKLQRE